MDKLQLTEQSYSEMDAKNLRMLLLIEQLEQKRGKKFEKYSVEDDDFIDF